MRDTHGFGFLDKISPSAVESRVFFSLVHTYLSIKFLIFSMCTYFDAFLKDQCHLLTNKDSDPSELNTKSDPL